MKLTLDQIISKLGMKRSELNKMSGISYCRLSTIGSNRRAPLNLETMERIYTATRDKFGIGLRPQEYLDYEFLQAPENGQYLTDGMFADVEEEAKNIESEVKVDNETIDN